MTIVKVLFDEWDITQFCHVRNISTRMQAARTNVFQTHPDRDGAYFKQSTLGQIVVEIKVSIRSNTLENIDILNMMLHSREPKRLFIDDMPDRYLMAILDNGDSPVSGRYYASTVTLKFISPDSYWRSITGPKTMDFDEEGRVVINDLGTADSPLSMDIEFDDDCGHLAIVTPYNHIELGNPEEVDAVEVPPTEFALNEEMDSLDGWTKLTDADLKKHFSGSEYLSATGQPKMDQWGLIADSGWPSVSKKWNGIFYKKDFDEGVATSGADNFHYRSRIDLDNLSGDRTAGILLYFTVYDTDDMPMMQVRIGDVSFDRNELEVIFGFGNQGIGDGVVYPAHQTKIDRVRGWISMDKRGNKLEWKVHNDAGAPPVATAQPALKVGDIVHLKNSANTIYDWNGRALRLNDIIKGVPLKITAIRDSPKGRYQLTNHRKGWVEGFFEADAIQEATVSPPKSTTSSGPVQRTFSGTYSEIGQRTAKGVSIGMFKYGANKVYPKASINSVIVQRIHTSNTHDIPNTFMPGDKLAIRDSEILLNGAVFNGQISYDSRPLYVEGGVPSEIALLPSSWAEMPRARVTYEKRWL